MVYQSPRQLFAEQLAGLADLHSVCRLYDFKFRRDRWANKLDTGHDLHAFACMGCSGRRYDLDCATQKLIFTGAAVRMPKATVVAGA